MADITLQLFCPGRLKNPLNASGWSHWQRMKWASEWKHTVRLVWLEAGRPQHDGPAAITFTGYVARRFDDDGFPACCKPLRDEAVRLICGTDDGPNCGHTFAYRQIVKPEYRGCLIEVAPRG